MSTHANIIVMNEDRAICIYRHHDGYPDGRHGVIAELKDAMKYALPLPRFDPCDFSAAIVRAWKGEGGGDIYIANASTSNMRDWSREEIVNEIADYDSEYTYIIFKGDRGGIDVSVWEFNEHLGVVSLGSEWVDNSTAPCESEP